MDKLPSIEEFIAAMPKASTPQPEPVEATVEVEAKEVVAPVEAAQEAVEAVAEEVSEDAPADKSTTQKIVDSVAKKFAALTRKEKEVRQKDQEAQRKLKEAEDRLRQLEDRDSKWSNVKKSPYKALKDAGLTLQDVLNDSVNQYEAPAEDPVKSGMEEMAKEIAELKNQLKSQIEQVSEKEYRVAVKEVESILAETFSSDPDNYELSIQFGQEAIDLAREIMGQYYQEHQKVLDYTELCGMVEKVYEDEVMSRIVNTKKVKSRLAPTPVEKSSPKQSSSKEASRPNTLSNQTGSVTKSKVDIDKLSPDDALSVLAKQLTFL